MQTTTIINGINWTRAEHFDDLNFVDNIDVVSHVIEPDDDRKFLYR